MVQNFTQFKISHFSIIIVSLSYCLCKSFLIYILTQKYDLSGASNRFHCPEKNKHEKLRPAYVHIVNVVE